MSSKSILIIDDDTDVKESTQIMLMDEGHEVILACDGRQGLEKYLETSPDITFLDIKMPGMDGYDTFFKIKEKDNDAKIAFITGFAVDDPRYESAKHNKLIATIRKPVELKTLIKIIDKYA